MALEPASEVATVHFAAGLYDIDAIKKAAYRLSDRATIDIGAAADEVVCVLRPITPKADLTALESEFRRHVLDYDLRARIAQETEPLRNLILSHAFSKTGLQK